MKIVIGTGPGDEVVAAWREEFPDVEFVPASTDEEQLLEVEDADGYIGRISRDAFRAPSFMKARAPARARAEGATSGTRR